MKYNTIKLVYDALHRDVKAVDLRKEAEEMEKELNRLLEVDNTVNVEEVDQIISCSLNKKR